MFFFAEADVLFRTTGVWSPWKHEKYDQKEWNNRTSAAGQRSSEPETTKTRLGPQNPGNWIRGCDPKTQDAKQLVPDPSSYANGNKSTASELSVPRLRDAQEKRTIAPRTTLQCDWRSSDKSRGDGRGEAGVGTRFSNLEYDSRSRGSQRTTLSFNNNSKHMDRNFSSNSHSHHRNSGYEDAPEWMSEPTSKFEMMTLGGFADDTRGIPEEQETQQKVASKPVPISQADERSITPDFERMMKDMLNLTEEDPVTEIPVMLTEPQTVGSKSSKWFSSGTHADRRPEIPASIPSAAQHSSCGPNDRAQSDLMQILQRANISLHQVQPHANLPPPQPVHIRSLDEIENGFRSDSSAGAEDKQAFNKLLDLLSRRGSGQQAAAQNAFVPMRPSAYEMEEMHRQRKILEAAQHVEQQQQLQQKNRPPAFSMVPIQVMRNATATDRRAGLLPNEPEGPIQPRAITGSAQSHAQQRPVTRMPVSPFGQEFEVQRQVMFQQEMMQRRNFSTGPRLPRAEPLGLSAGNRAALSAQQMQQLQQLQMMNQQLHQLNPTQLQQTRGMSAAQIQQFLLRSAPAQHS